MSAGEQFPAQETFLISSGNLNRIITLPFATLTTPWSYIGQVYPPVMLETWLRESRFDSPPSHARNMAAGEQFPARETFLISSGNLDRINTPPFSAPATPCRAGNMVAGEQVRPTT